MGVRICRTLTASPMNEAHHDQEPVHLLWVALLVEGGMLIVALVIGWFGFYEKSQPLYELDWNSCLEGLGWGIAATVPMVILMLVIHYWGPEFFRPMNEFVANRLKPMFETCTLFELFLLSLMAGLGEEIFFRWCLQGGLADVLSERFGVDAATWTALIAVSFLFGLCHWVNASYGITTFLIGIYLGWTMIQAGNWLVPAVAHALFDFLALLFITRSSDRYVTPEQVE